MIDRLGIRARPPGRPIMHQTWAKLLFLHWKVPEASLRPLIPHRLELDTWSGDAWVAVTPFTMSGLRPPFLPAVPWLSRSHELNVRTYVHHDGVPGVWFFSLDAANPLAVIGARLAFHLPYFLASMQLRGQGETHRFRSRRTQPGTAPAEFDATWTGAAPLAELQSETLEFFLIERYCLYAARRTRLYRSRIFHRPWPLRRAELSSLSSTMLEAAGIGAAAGAPLLHQQREPIEVEVWPLERL